MGVKVICEHGFYIDGCRCMRRHAVTVKTCPWSGVHPSRTYRVQAGQVLNPDVLPSTVVDRTRGE